MADFFQQPPALGNPFTSDPHLRLCLQRKLPPEIFKEIEPDLHAFGADAAERLDALARRAESEPPRHVPYDPWGRRTDTLRLSPAWDALRATSAREGLVSIAYVRRHGEFSRLHQFAKLFIFHPVSAFFSCPVAMTDGAARILEAHAAMEACHDALARLTSRDPARFWISGQWMTERTGGSDVSGTTTIAEPHAGAWRLRGSKHFTSAAEADIALALARKPDAPAGSRGLTLFMAHPRNAGGDWSGVMVRQLKDKLGTRALATAELDLVGCRAVQIGGDGEGVRTITAMLNITRLHNSICALAEASRALAALDDYARKRIVFGKPLAAQPLFGQTMARLRADLLAGLILTMELAHLLGRDESGTATAQDRAILRLMTPACKITTAKTALTIASEAVEGFGGAGYIEDIGIARHLRDAQVFSIWEGPTNVLALDVLRAMRSLNGVDAVLEDMSARLAASDCKALKAQVAELAAKTRILLRREPAEQEASARDLAVHLAALYAAALAVDFVTEQQASALVERIPPWRFA